MHERRLDLSIMSSTWLFDNKLTLAPGTAKFFPRVWIEFGHWLTSNKSDHKKKLLFFFLNKLQPPLLPKRDFEQHALVSQSPSLRPRPHLRNQENRVFLSYLLFDTLRTKFMKGNPSQKKKKNNSEFCVQTNEKRKTELNRVDSTDDPTRDVLFPKATQINVKETDDWFKQVKWIRIQKARIWQLASNRPSLKKVLGQGRVVLVKLWQTLLAPI